MSRYVRVVEISRGYIPESIWLQAALGWLRSVNSVELTTTAPQKQSFQGNCLIGPLYTAKLPLESDDHPVTALPCADLELSTEAVWKRKIPSASQPVGQQISLISWC